MKIYDGYLTEEKLGTLLHRTMPEGKWISNKCVPNSGCKYRPDYRNDHYMVIVEYDGPSHYTSAKRVLTDYDKIEIFTDMGYKVINIPYFLQIDDIIFQGVFQPNGADKNGYEMSRFPHGFISDNCVLPADFCTAGLMAFALQIHKDFWPARDSILLSLKNKTEELGLATVMPLNTKDFSEHLPH